METKKEYYMQEQHIAKVLELVETIGRESARGFHDREKEEDYDPLRVPIDADFFDACADLIHVITGKCFHAEKG